MFGGSFELRDTVFIKRKTEGLRWMPDIYYYPLWELKSKHVRASIKLICDSEPKISLAKAAPPRMR